MWKNLLSMGMSFVGGSSVQIYIYLAIVFGGFSAGFYVEHLRFSAYETRVEAAGAAAQAKTESIQKQHEIVTKGISDEYDTKIANLRNYYKSTSVWDNNGGNNMSGLSTAPKSADVISAYNQLASNCSQTTLMLVELQKWINEQIGIK
jgi:hypothetical protein